MKSFHLIKKIPESKLNNIFSLFQLNIIKKHLFNNNKSILTKNTIDIKGKKTPIKVYLNSKKFSEKYPTVDENTDFLLRELNKIRDNKLNNENNNDKEVLNKYFFQNENILFVDIKILDLLKNTNTRNEEELKKINQTLNQNNPNNNKTINSNLLIPYYGQHVSINNKIIAQVISITQSLVTLLLYNNFNINNERIYSFDLTPSKEVLSNFGFKDKSDSINSNTVCQQSSLEGFTCNLDYSLLFNDKLSASLTKNYRLKSLINSPLSTGQIFVDYIKPLNKGNFILMKGSSNYGQEQMIEGIIERFQGKVLLLTMNNKLVSKLSKSDNASSIKVFLGNLNNLNSTTSHIENGLSKNTLLPRILLNTAKLHYNLISNKQNYNNTSNKPGESNDTLVILDNIVDFLISSKISYTNAKCYYPSSNFINEFFELTGVYEGGSITTLIV